MLMFGSSVGHPDLLAKCAVPGLASSMGERYVYRAVPTNNRSIYPTYAMLMVEAHTAGVEALVLMHDDLEFCDIDLAAKLRAAFADPTVAVVGLIGARNVQSLRWWQGDRRGRVEDTGYGLHDFGFDGGSVTDVDSVDGMMIALSPWALANLSLDVNQDSYHGYDAELCFQARARGKRAVVADITAFHHSKGGFTQGLADAEAVFQKRWAATFARPVCTVCSKPQCAGHTSLIDTFTTHTKPVVDAVVAFLSADPNHGMGLQAESEPDAPDPRLPAMIRRVQEAGTDSLAHFGNGYTHEGGLYLQQNPEEFAKLALLLRDRSPINTYLEIGSASGGVCRLLRDEAMIYRALSIDDGKHPRASAQPELLKGVTCYRGDSHSPDASVFLDYAAATPIDVAFIDGDHSYEGVTADINMMLPRCEPGALIILHDTVACDGVRRAWEELLASGRARRVAEFIGAEKPLGIGVAEVVMSGSLDSRAAEAPAGNPADAGATPAPTTNADPWHLLRTPGPWTAEAIDAMYTAHRGSPVSDTPLVHMIVPSYRESYDIVKLCDPSRQAIIQDLLDHGMNVCRSDIDGDSLVQRMRQRAMHLFLKGTGTHLLWCDLDIEARDPTCVRKMLASGFDIVGGACPFKNATPNVVCNFLPSMAATMDVAQLELPHGCLEVHDVGTGFQLVSRRAILQLMAAHPELLHWSRSHSDYGEPLFALYDTGVVDGTYESEDFLFCRYWQKLGGRVYVYVPATFRHYGTHGFEASIMEKLGLVAV
jgi:cephalosporin hydroxylase